MLDLIFYLINTLFIIEQTATCNKDSNFCPWSGLTISPILIVTEWQLLQFIGKWSYSLTFYSNPSIVITTDKTPIVYPLKRWYFSCDYLTSYSLTSFRVTIKFNKLFHLLCRNLELTLEKLIYFSKICYHLQLQVLE